MAKLTPYIQTEDARAQAEFYVQSLGGEVQSVITFGQGAPDMKKEFHDKVMHLSLVAAGNNLYMSDSFEPVSEGKNISLSLEFATEAETSQAFDNLARGGKVLHPLEQQPWGAYYGEVKDKFGVKWMILKQM
jgi:PhnB protein